VFASRVFDRELLDHFDIVGWDPRGTGESDPPIDCIADYDPYFTEIDTTPESAAERERVIEAAQEFADRCVESNATLIEHVGTNDSARDMDTIRRALGEDQISYFGFSYGSELGGVWATLFPETVRAAVLDGASDPTADSQESALQQLRGFDAALDVFLSECAADDECAFHNDGDPAAALDALLVELDETPAPTEDGRPPVNRDVAINGVLHAMYSERYWPALAESLSDAQQGDGSGLLALHDAYFQRFPDGTYGNELEAFQAISCADQAERPTIDEAEAESAELHAATPRLVPEGSIGFFCTFFPAALDPRAEITADGVGPVVVIGTTGDAATPLTSTAKMAEALPDGRLVVVEANEHTGYGVNRCVVEVVNQYLVELDAPDDGTECR
jgi:pimeloyl-ACP methyl ester carboxylesterase